MLSTFCRLTELHNFWVHRPFHFIPSIIDMVEISDSACPEAVKTPQHFPVTNFTMFSHISLLLHFSPLASKIYACLQRRNRPPPTWRPLPNPSVCHVLFHPLGSDRQVWNDHNGKHSLHRHTATTRLLVTDSLPQGSIEHSKALSTLFHVQKLTDSCDWLVSLRLTRE